MKAVRFMEPEIFEVSDVPIPEINDEEVLVRIKAAGICATDLDLLTGDMPHIKNGFTKYPLIPGHEWSGEIEKVGSKVVGFKKGDRVTSDVSIGCGKCNFCKNGRYNLCPNRVVVGSYRNKDGAYSEYITIPYKNLFKLPDNISFEEGALAEPAATAAYGVTKTGIGFGDNVLIFGDGPIGQLAMQCAKIAGASKVFQVGSWDEKLKIAKDTGADYTMNYHRDDIVNITKELTDGEGVDVIIETSGNSKAFNQAIQALKPGGKIGLLSFYGEWEMKAQINSAIVKDCEIVCALASPNSFKPVLSLMESGRINVKPLITHKFALERFSDALELIRARKEYRIKILIIP